MKTKHLVMIAVAVLAAAVLLTLYGCKKKEQPAPAPVKAPTMEEMTKKAASTAGEVKKTATATAEEAKKAAATVEVEQTMCPVMDGMKINKYVFIEYKGKKVYFCCADCKGKFEANPEKYIANLPQFQK